MPSAAPAPATELDPAICPLCGMANQCAMEAQRASGEVQPPCWCTRASIARETLARLPAAQRGRSCICPACAAAGG